MPDITEGPPEERWDNAVNRDGWTGKQLIFRHTFEAFDSLPPAVRRAFHQLTVTFEPVPVAKFWNDRRKRWRPNKRLIRSIVDQIAAAEHADLLNFDQIHFQRWGRHLPHVAAEATILRYDSGSKGRH